MAVSRETEQEKVWENFMLVVTDANVLYNCIKHAFLQVSISLNSQAELLWY